MSHIKKCSICNETKHIDIFSKRKSSSDSHASRCKDCDKVLRQKNREKNRISRQRWAENNREKEYQYQKNRRQIDINYKIVGNLRHRIWMALEGNVKSIGTKSLLGCSIEFFKLHLEKQFIIGMNWDNYGENGWHVGHIIPCKFFDLSNPKEQEICFHHSNLRPEWELDNIKNNDKLPCGRRARDFSREEKILYLKDKGFNI